MSTPKKTTPSTPTTSTSTSTSTTSTSTSFAIILLIVSLVTHKITHIFYDKFVKFKLLEIRTYLWLPSVFLWDVCYVICFIYSLRLVAILITRAEEIQMAEKKKSPQSLPHSSLPHSSLPSTPSSIVDKKKGKIIVLVVTNYLKKKLPSIILGLSSISALIISSMEVKNLISRGERVSWGMTMQIFLQWDSFRGMIMSKAKEGVSIWSVGLFQLITAMVVKVFLGRRSFSCTSFRQSFTSLRPSLSSLRSPSSSSSCNTLFQKIKKRTNALHLVIIYLCLVFTVRPTDPYQLLSHTPMVSVPITILTSIITYQKPKKEKELLKLKETFLARKEPPKGIESIPDFKNASQPLNIALIILETVRADMFPFDPTTPWAKRLIPEAASLVTNTNNSSSTSTSKSKSITNKITPFYANWVNKPSTLYIPNIRSPSSFTHKALWSIFCSTYAKPERGTPEYLSNIHHECLPHLLEKSGMGYTHHQFFKSITSTFNHQFQLAENFGFESMYGRREYDNQYKPNETFISNHTANYFGYEDDVILEPVSEWLDQTQNKSSTRSGKVEPFLFSYITGATHDPYNSPPRISWDSKTYVNDTKINGFLNAIAYTDRFLSKLVGQFKQRGLMNNTLFVIMGDHGANFKNRDDDSFTTYQQHTEEMYDVGISFFTENKEVSEVLTTVKNSGTVEQGMWNSIDMTPTILDLLYRGDHDGTTLLNGKYEGSIVDGRSMLRPSGKRLQFSIANPGDGMVLKDGSYVILVPSRSSETFPQIELSDLEKDPNQSNPIILSPWTWRSDDLIHWGKQAVKFVKLVELDLIRAHTSGVRCNDCALSLLFSIESLDQWPGYKHKRDKPNPISRLGSFLFG